MTLRTYAIGESCSFGPCDRQVTSKGLCSAHYLQRYRGEKLRPIGRPVTSYEADWHPCVFPGCDGTAARADYCKGHRKQIKEGRPLAALRRRTFCSFEDCDRQCASRGLCHAHAKQRDRGQELHPIRKGRQARYVNTNGYVIVPSNGHPNGYPSGKILEHVVVMSEVLGRPLRKGESVHHKNGVKHDNRHENLELWTGVGAQPKGVRVADLVAWAQEIIDTYGDEVRAHPVELGVH